MSEESNAGFERMVIDMSMMIRLKTIDYLEAKGISSEFANGRKKCRTRSAVQIKHLPRGRSLYQCTAIALQWHIAGGEILNINQKAVAFHYEIEMK